MIRNNPAMSQQESRKPRASGDDPWFRDRLKNELL